MDPMQISIQSRSSQAVKAEFTFATLSPKALNFLHWIISESNILQISPVLLLFMEIFFRKFGCTFGFLENLRKSVGNPIYTLAHKSQRALRRLVRSLLLAIRFKHLANKKQGVTRSLPLSFGYDVSTLGSQAVHCLVSQTYQGSTNVLAYSLSRHHQLNISDPTFLL